MLRAVTALLVAYGHNSRAKEARALFDRYNGTLRYQVAHFFGLVIVLTRANLNISPRPMAPSSTHWLARASLAMRPR